jgi:hypothetical protein
MEIQLKRNYGYYLIIKAENVNIEEDVEERIYSKTEDGKIDFSKPPVRDISTVTLDQMTSILSDLIYYREREYDASSLIKQLFDKLPMEVGDVLIKELNNK